jgi:hypothetical protein
MFEKRKKNKNEEDLSMYEKINIIKEMISLATVGLAL